MYRHVPDCTDCKAMANLTSIHLAEIKVEEGRIKSDGRKGPSYSAELKP